MNARIVGAAAALLLGTSALLAAPAGRLAPKDIETLFFNGKPFTASTPANVKFAKSGAKSEGTWKLSTDGFCSTWKGSKQNCYRVQESGPNKWAIIVSTQAVAYWSK
jgi:hypothetical protein